MDSVIAKAAGVLGVPDDLLRIAFCIIASFPLCSVVKRIPTTKLVWKDGVILAAGIFYLVGIFQLYLSTLFLLATALVTYMLAIWMPQNRQMPTFNFYTQMALMLATHCIEQFGGDDFVNNIGISGTQMIMLQKLTSYAWDVYDGTRAPEKLQAQQLESRITVQPSFLRYLSWLFFFPTVLTGPACTFNEYNSWLDMSMYKDLRTITGEPLKRAPHSGVALWSKLGEALMWVFMYTQFGSLFPDYQLYNHGWYMDLSVVRRLLTVYVLALVYRTKYYSAWLLSEAACIHSGLGFSGTTPDKKKMRWDRMKNVSPMSVETAQNFHGIFASWNIITSHWLRNYVYLRVTPEGKKPGTKSTFITFATSAIWHGTRPGYYLTFVLGAVYQTFGKVFRRSIRPVFLNSSKKWAYDFVCLVVTQFSLSFAVMPFILLDLGPSFRLWASLYFYPIVGLMLSWIIILGPLSSYVMPKLNLLSRDLKKTD